MRLRQMLAFVFFLPVAPVLADLCHVAASRLSSADTEPQPMVIDFSSDIEPVCVFPSSMFQPMGVADGFNEPIEKTGSVSGLDDVSER